MIFDIENSLLKSDLDTKTGSIFGNLFEISNQKSICIELIFKQGSLSSRLYHLGFANL